MIFYRIGLFWIWKKNYCYFISNDLCGDYLLKGLFELVKVSNAMIGEIKILHKYHQEGGVKYGYY